MSDAKEFTGKTLDEAIEEACRHFDLDRAKLEIEIISGGSSGIFGLVGKKKAIVKARPRTAATIPVKEKPARTEAPAREPKPQPAEPRPPRGEEKKRRPEPKPQPAAQPTAQPAAQPDVQEVAPAPAPEQPKRPAPAPTPAAPEPAPEQPAPAAPEAAEAPATRPAGTFEPEPDEPVEVGVPLDNPELEALLREAVTRLTEVIAGPVEIELLKTTDRIKILIKDEEQAGILIGREGQTLNALQYLVNRIVAKRWPEQVKVQLDTGAYRERQDDKLRQMALFLADKAKTMGRPQSTKPLSSYHRRVIHLALQSDESISTRSKGEGPMKRVIIVPKREKQGRAEPQA